jgi:hypothetical protein
MSLEKIEIQKIYTETGYLYNYCEKIFLLKNYLEDKLFKDFPDRMVFETSIWMIGSFIEQEIRKNKKILNNLLFEEVKKIIQTKKYLTGRQGFVMLLHYFKKNISEIDEMIENMLKDKYIYGFVISEMIKLKLFSYKKEVQSILEEEETGWIKKKAKKYLEKVNEYELFNIASL